MNFFLKFVQISQANKKKNNKSPHTIEFVLKI